MKVIVGLGNPGPDYEDTRHNVGWLALDHLADVWRFDRWKKDGKAAVSTGSVRGTRVRLVKPLTYMNLSGQVLRPYLRRESWNAANDLLVVVDDVALPVGRVRLRPSGSAGGHNGLKSIETALGSREYARLRIGVGPQPGRTRGERELADYVLSAFTRSERAIVKDLLPRVAEATEAWIGDGIERAMNELNRDSNE